jgi:glycosyltransferase involved in cell wall biosynthesis
LKILQIIQRSQLRGAEIFACQLSETLQSQGHEVDVLILFGAPSDVFTFPLNFIFLNADEKKRWWDFTNYKRLNAIIRNGEYDIVQANAGDTLKYASLSKKMFRWKAKLVFRNANKISDFINSGLKKTINRWLMKEVSSVASVSKECMLDFQRVYSGFDHRIACLPIGVKIETTIPYSSLAAIGINGVGPFLLHVAGFMPEKNHVGLISIFTQMLESHPESKLLLIGEGKLKTKIQNLVNEYALDKKVFFLGKRDDVLRIMPCCDALLLPSLTEGLPGVILESFLSGLPVVAYDTGGIKEVVVSQQTGWLVPLRDEKQFLEAIKQALSYKYESIKSNAYALVSNEYDIQTITKHFVGFYEKTIA